MYALFIILNDMYLVDDVHEILSRCEVGGTLFNSTGLGKVNMHYNNEDYTFTSIRKILSGNKPKNVTIISIIKSEEKLDEVKKIDHWYATKKLELLLGKAQLAIQWAEDFLSELPYVEE